VRLAALDLERDSGLDLDGSGLDYGIPCFSPKFTVLTLCLNVIFLCKFVEFNVDAVLTHRLHDAPYVTSG